MKFIVFDIETNGLLDSVSKVHCFSYKKDGVISSLSSIEDIKQFVEANKDYYFVGHNIVLYDLKVLKKFGIKIEKVIDTLWLAYYLYPKRDKYGLEAFGKDFKVLKKEIKDWNNLSLKEYIERCEIDVKINDILFFHQLELLNKIYEGNYLGFLRYLMFKVDCISTQEDFPLFVDEKYLSIEIEKLEDLLNEKKDALESELPKILKTKKKVVKNAFLIEGTFPQEYVSQETDSFKFSEYIQMGFKPIERAEIEVFDKWVNPNANSVQQIKDYLFSIGWQPIHFKKTISKEGEHKKVPQINSEFVEGEVCQSIKDLFPKAPFLENLNEMGILKHRIGLLKGIEKNKNGREIKASAAGLTNTLRLKHVNVVNLPKPIKKYGSICRGVFVAPSPDYLICGADLSQLEDNTKRHFIYPLDPEYVKAQMSEGYDAHLEIAKLAGLLTEEQVEEHKTKKVDHSEKRSIAKNVNFSATYGIGAKGLASNLKVDEKFAKSLLKTYWDRNWSIKDFAASLEVKEIDGQKWLKSPLSGFWLSLRAEKDRFSTCNQNAGVYVFDLWIAFLRSRGIIVRFQMHDEVLFILKKEDKDIVKEKVLASIEDVNKKLNLNIKISCDIKFGENYSQVH